MRSPTYEQALTKQGVSWTYLERVKLDEINTRKGLANQARLEKPLDEQLIEQYAAAIKEGSDFPPLVLARPGRGKYVPLDGNQRIAAFGKVGKQYHDAYLVNSEDQMVLDRIAWSFNNKVNGQRLSYEECLAHAVSFVRKYGMTHDTAAKEWGVPKWSVSREVRSAELRETLERNRVKVTPAFTPDVLSAMGVLETMGEDIFVPAARVVSENGLGVADVGELVKEVRKAKTHAAKVTSIQEFGSSDRVQARRAETKGGTVKVRSPLPRERLPQLLRPVLRLLEEFPDRKTFLAPNKERLKKDRELAADVVHKLITTYGLGTTLQNEEAV